MTEETTAPPVDFNRLICAIVDAVGGEVLVTNDTYLNAPVVQIVDVEDGYLFRTVTDPEELNE
jgi:hypothetical protein